MPGCIFCKFANKTLSKEFTYEDSDIMVFPDINPIKRVHLLVIPKKHLKDFRDLEDAKLMQKITQAIQKMIVKEKLMGKGYRIVVNGGGAQIIDHLHFHLTGPWGAAAAL